MTEDVPGYRVLEQVGEGGFSVVYLAYQERLDRQVALKVLSTNAIDEGSMRRFQRECKITGRLSGHPNVVTVLDTGTSRSGRPYIAMEYFEHGSLSDRVEREGPLPVADVLRIGVKTASALAATHETEVLHRDVKPQNILLSRYGEPALADFGIAGLVDSFDATHTNAFTPHHAAPELLEGKPPTVASDLYSLGSTLYQLLAGRPAFQGAPDEGLAQLMLRILGEPPPVISHGDLPRPVFDAIAQAMAKSPRHRFTGAVDFARRLQGLQAELGLPVTDLLYARGAAGGRAATGSVAVPSQTPSSSQAPFPVGAPQDPWTPAAPGPEAFVSSPGPGEHAMGTTAPPAPAWHTRPPEGEVVSGLRTEVSGRRTEMSGGRTERFTGHASYDLLNPDAPPGGPATGRNPLDATPSMPASMSSSMSSSMAPPMDTPMDPGPGSDPSTPADGPGRGLLVAGAVALAGGLAIGLTGLVVFTSGPGKAPEPASAPSRPAARAGAGQTTGDEQTGVRPLTAHQIRAAAPRAIKVRTVGTSARLSWTLPPSARRLPVIVQRSPAGRTAVSSAGTGAVTTTVGGLKPHGRYCFRVGALLSPGNPPIIAWSAIRCVRAG